VKPAPGVVAPRWLQNSPAGTVVRTGGQPGGSEPSGTRTIFTLIDAGEKLESRKTDLLLEVVDEVGPAGDFALAGDRFGPEAFDEAFAEFR
jgi:hypothetical protein